MPGECLASTEVNPDNVASVNLEPSFIDEGVFISMHVDSIQAMLRVLHDNQGQDLWVKGRVADTQQDIDTITSDLLYRLFTGLRSVQRAEFMREASRTSGTRIVRPVLRADDSLNGFFVTRFYSADDLVDRWLSGQTNGNRLMPVFGGLTTIDLGTNDSSKSKLLEVGEKLKNEIWLRQLGGSVVSMLNVAVLRSARQPRVRSASKLLNNNDLNNIQYNH